MLTISINSQIVKNILLFLEYIYIVHNLLINYNVRVIIIITKKSK